MSHHDTHDHDHRADHEGPHEHDLGLAHDLTTLLDRRRALAILGGGTLAALVAGCAAGAATVTPTSTSTPAAPAGGAGGGPGGPGDSGSAVDVADGEIPEETAGPFPGDGSNGVNVLTESGIVRSDITTSFGSASGVAQGVPLKIEMTLLDLSGTSSKPMQGAAIYVWHCNRDGAYSLYDGGAADENYLRGVQETDADGKVTFTSIYPGAYSGRWPHIHFEVYPGLDDATSSANKLRTSQIALPEDVSALVYATDGYEQSVQNLAQSSLDTDNVFSDGYSLQLATVTGSVADGFTARLNVPV